MMFKLLRLEDRIVLDGAAPGEVLKQSSFADLDHDDTFSAFQHNRSAFENDISEPLLTADAIGAETYPDETNILLISSDIADDDVLSGAVADDVILIRYNAGETDLKDLSSLINDALAGKKAESIGFALHSSDAGLQLTRGENVSAQSLTQDIDHLSFWQDIGDMLADGGRIDLLSCNIAGTAEGDALLAALEDISGKNVAASDNATGNAPDGDWILESANIDAAKIYFDADALADFEGLLAVPEQNNPYPSDFGGSSGFLMNEGAEINYPLFSHFRDPADPAATLVFENVSKMAVEPFMGDTGWLTLTTDGYLQGTVPGTSGDATVYEYSIGFDVKSGADILAGQSFTLKDGNTAPALDGIAALPDLEITQGAAFSASLVDYFNDAETGKNLFFTDNNPPGGDTSWLTFNSDGTVSGTVPNDGVKYTLNFTVSDGLGGTVTESLTLQTANTAPYPTGALPTIDITEGSAVGGSLLDYYTDDQQTKDQLSVTEINIIAVEPFLGATGWLTVDPATGNLSGTVPDNPTGGAEYIIEFRVSDGTLSTVDIQSITLKQPAPTNTAPYPTGALPIIDIIEGSAVGGSLLDYYTDDQQTKDQLSITEINIIAVEPFLGATGWLTVDPATGNLSGTVPVNPTGGAEYIIEFRVSDGTLSTVDIQSITLKQPPETPPHLLPTLTELPAIEIIEGQDVSGSLLAYYTDDQQSQDQLRITDIEIIPVEPFMGDTGWLTVDEFGKLSGTVPVNPTGGVEYNINFKVSDGALKTEFQTITLQQPPDTPPHLLPTLTELPTIEIIEGQDVSASLLAYYTDDQQSQDQLRITDIEIIPVEPFMGDTTWLTVDEFGNLSGTVPDNPTGGAEYNINFKVSDGALKTEFQTITLQQPPDTPPHLLPTLTELPTIEIIEGQDVSGSLLAYYTDDQQSQDQLRITDIEIIPVEPFMGDTTWLTVDEFGNLSGTVPDNPTGGAEYNINFKVSDGALKTEFQTITLQQPPNTPPHLLPTLTELPTIEIIEGQDVSGSLLAYYTDDQQTKDQLRITDIEIIPVEPFMGDTTWLTVDEFGNLSGTVPDNPTGGAEYNINFKVSDGALKTEYQTITLQQPANTPPHLIDTLTELPVLPISEGVAVSGSLLDYYTDNEQDHSELRIILEDKIGVEPFLGSTDWLTVDEFGNLSGTVPVNPDGGAEYNIEFRVSDGETQTDVQVITLKQSNVVTLSVSPASFNENGGVATVTATLNNASDQDVTVNLVFTGTAGAGDYNASGNSIFITAGNTTGTITLTGVDDTVDDDNEKVIVDIDTVVNASEGVPNQIIATIIDDDTPYQPPGPGPGPGPVNSPPVFNDQTFTIEENTVIEENSPEEMSVGTVTGYDPNGGALKFEIIDGNTGDAFQIDENTGKITVKNPDALDFETDPVFELDIRITDSGGLTDTMTATIKITDVDDPPIASAEPGVNEFTIPENSPEETGVGTVAAFDQDGDGIIYSIADGNIDDVFSIDADTGQITVNNPEALDYETNPVFTLTILLQDGDNPSLSTTTTVVIRLEDVLEEAPVYNDTEFTIEENSPEDTFVGQQIALDPDGDNITYAIIDGNTGDAFSIDPETGVITVNNADMMDYETYPVFTLTVQATDDGSPSQSDTGTVTIRLLDVEPEGEVNAPPVLGDTEFSLAENSAEGTPVGTLSGSDPDNDVLTYAIIDGNTDGAFFVNPETGEIIVSNPDVLDYETNPVFTLTVQVTDAEGLSDTAKVTIELDDIKGVTARPDTAVTDENTPITINVLENDVLEESAGTLSISSIDSSELSGTVTLNDDYTITYNPLDSQQIQNLTAGQTLTDTFTYTITDGLGGTDTGTVSITVSGVDEPAPPASFIILPETEYWRWGYKNTPWAWGARGDIWEWGYFRDIDAPWGPSHSVMFESDILGLYIDRTPSVIDIDSYGVQDFRLTTVFGHYTDNGLPVFVLKDMELPDFDFALPDEGEDLYELANRMLDEAQAQSEFRGEEKAVQTEKPAE